MVGTSSPHQVEDKQRVARFKSRLVLFGALGYGAFRFHRWWEGSQMTREKFRDLINSKLDDCQSYLHSASVKRLLVGETNDKKDKETAPFLPDTHDLKYPANLPTLVMGLEGTLGSLDYNTRYGWTLTKRPFADKFIRDLMFHYEMVVWTKMQFPIGHELVSKWGLPVIGTLHSENTKAHVRDLSRLGRDLKRTIMIDCDPSVASLQPDNFITVPKFEGNPNDQTLLKLKELLIGAATQPGDVRRFLRSFGSYRDMTMMDRYFEGFQQRAQRMSTMRSVANWMLGPKRL